MIRLGLRFAVAGGRDAIARLAIIAAAVSVGTLLLLTVLGGLNGFFAQNHRLSWLNSDGESAVAGSSTTDHDLWWRLGYDLYQGQTIVRVDVAATGANSPLPPGIPRLPTAGEYYLSPELASLVRSVPASQLADRYPGHLIGEIGPAALQSPESLVAVIGHRPDELSGDPTASLVSHIQGTSAAECENCGGVGVRTAGIDLVISVVAGGLLFPVLIFIATVTRLNAARREERFAALRLIGATPQQVAILSTVEAVAATMVGVLFGFVLFFLLRGQIAAVPFTGVPFFVSDVRLGLTETIAVAIGIPFTAGLAARIALRRVRISPLGVTRRTTPGPPRAYRLIPLVVGIAELGYFVGRRPATWGGQTLAFMSGFLLIMAGLVVAGPWLTMVGARFLAARSRRPAALIAARRLADNPGAGFRAVSGLVVALFVASVATGVITSIDAVRDPTGVSSDVRGTLIEDFWRSDGHPGIAAVALGSTPARLAGIPGVRDVTVIRANPAFVVGAGRPTGPTGPDELVSCSDLPRVLPHMHCPPGVEVAAIGGFAQERHVGVVVDQTWPWLAPDISASRLAELPVRSLLVRTDGSAAAVENARTTLEIAYPDRFPPALDREFSNPFASNLAGWQQLADIVIVASLVLAGFGLAVAVAGGLSERKRPFSLLRLTGVPLGVLRRVIVLETGVPLLVAAAVATAAGFTAAALFLNAQLQYPLHSPDIGYYLISGVGLLFSVVIIASTLPLLRRITGPETARNG